ncbi:hypothetical protein ACO0QE_001599 [Hanseniaspora vineae]
MSTEPSELGLRSERLRENTVKKRGVVDLTDSSEAKQTTKKLKYCDAKVTHGLLFRPQELSYDTLHQNLSTLLLPSPNELFNTAEVRKAFENLYKCCVKHHLVKTLRIVIEKHLNYVLSLLKDYSNYSNAIGDEILFLHNITNHNECKDIIDILQADFTAYNSQYLGSIKMLLLQYLLKSPAEDKYKMPLVTFFSKDQRFLYGGKLSTIKPTSILKVLLHLFTKYPEIKAFFGMKILQYQKVKKSELYHPTPSNKTFIVNERWLAKVEKSFDHTDNLKIYQLYYHYIHYLYLYNTPLIKEHSTLLDQILLTINNNLKSFYANPSLLNTVKATIYYLGEYLFDHKQFKKIPNVINVAFNLYVTHNTDDLLKLAANFQMKLFYQTGEKDIWSKFKKFIKCSFSMELKFAIFSQIYNIFPVMAFPGLKGCCEFVFDGCVELSNLLPGLQLEELDFTSSLMNCLLYSQTAKKKHQIPIEGWPILVQMLYQTLDPYVELPSFDVNTKITRHECLHENQVLVKCMYSLYLEMKKRRCVNLNTITTSYIEKRLKKNDFEESVIENLFVSNLATYLNFNNNYELIQNLYEGVPESYVKGQIQKFFTAAASQLTNKCTEKPRSVATKLVQNVRVQLLNLIVACYDCLLEECVFMSLTNHFEYFIKEFVSLSQVITDPVIQFECYYFARLFANLTSDNSYTAMTKNVTHLIDMNQNLVALGKLAYVDSNVSLLFKEYGKHHYFLLTKWLIKLGVHMNDISTPSNLLNGPEINEIKYTKLSMIELHQYWTRTGYDYKVADYIKSCSEFYEKHCCFNSKDFTPASLISPVIKHGPDISTFQFPKDYNIVSIDICVESNKLIISQFLDSFQNHFFLDVTRNDKKYSNFSDLINAFKTIVDLSNGTTAAEVTSCVKTKEDRKKWWETRFELDSKMKSLLHYIEEKVLGAFANIFAPYYFDQSMPEFQKFEQETKALGLKFNMQHLGLIFNQEKPHELIDQGIIDEYSLGLLRTLINKHGKKLELCKKPVKHTVLITSNQSHAIPWESLATLEPLSVSRMPSLHSLHKLLQTQNQCIHITKKDVAMIINPNGDLPKTQSRFENLIFGCESVIVNEKPTSKQFMNMLEERKAFVYIGHGSGDQYVRVSEIKKSAKISPSFLLGCSSAYMKPRGQLNSTGTIIGYLLGGAPFVVGNLWDVTDKDVDKFSLSMFEKMGFLNTNANEYQNVAAAVSRSRNVCKLRYLNGAAPIVYGLPIEIKFL